MTFADAKEILEKVRFDMNYVSILNSPMVKAGDGIVALFENGIYKVYATDRHVPFNVSEFTNEDEASRDFLARVFDGFDSFYDFPKDIL